MLNMMIDLKGKPYEIGVVSSSGNAALEKAAINAVPRMSFMPAKRGKTPIDSSLTFKMVFRTGVPAAGASREFISTFKDFLKAVDSGDKQQADRALPALQAQNLYEDAFKGYAMYLYDGKWGTEADQLTDLQRAAAFESTGKYLPKDVFSSVLAAQFFLEVKTSDFGSALNTWKHLQPIAPASARGQLQQMVEKITALRSSDAVVRTPGQIRSGRSDWNSVLFKSHFSISVTNGTVAEIKLRCKQKYFLLNYERDIQYTVDPRAGECYIEVVGDPGSTFELDQS